MKDISRNEAIELSREILRRAEWERKEALEAEAILADARQGMSPHIIAADIRRIWMIVEDACLSAHNDIKPHSREAVNWGDLHCADVGTKNDGYYAVIEEATPGCTELVEYVYDRLVDAGFDNVDVTTEW